MYARKIQIEDREPMTYAPLKAHSDHSYLSQPEKHLAIALLQGAIDDLTPPLKNPKNKTFRRRMDRVERAMELRVLAIEFLTSDADEWLYFRHCCEAVGLDDTAIASVRALIKATEQEFLESISAFSGE